MPESRRSLLLRTTQMIGQEAVSVVETRSGWPSVVDVVVGEEIVCVAIHIGPIGFSHRNRDDIERRFQNPGKGRPMAAPSGTTPLLIGLWEEAGRAVLVGMEATHRLGRETRQSLFIPLWLLQKISGNRVVPAPKLIR